MDGAGLSRRLDLAAVQRAVAIEPELALMVAAIGLNA
jgi:hypothetical protein